MVEQWSANFAGKTAVITDVDSRRHAHLSVGRDGSQRIGGGNQARQGARDLSPGQGTGHWQLAHGVHDWKIALSRSVRAGLACRRAKSHPEHRGRAPEIALHLWALSETYSSYCMTCIKPFLTALWELALTAEQAIHLAKRRDSSLLTEVDMMSSRSMELNALPNS